MNNTYRIFLAIFFIAGFTSLTRANTYAHCEIPCGIYNDSVRIVLIKEHIETIEKSIKMIAKLSEASEPDNNQLVRWVMNKEEHAEKIQEIVSQYFMHQRVKIAEASDTKKYEKYINQLMELHQISFYAMKAKQSLDAENISKLRKAVSAFEESYFHKH